MTYRGIGWCLLLILLAGCAEAQALITPSVTNAYIAATRTSVPLVAAHLDPAGTTTPPVTPGAEALPGPTSLPTLNPGIENTPIADAAITDTPIADTLPPEPASSNPGSQFAPAVVPVAKSWDQPWQFFSSSFNSGGTVIYRLRYPAGWSAYPGAAGLAILQNFSGSPADAVSPAGAVPLPPGGIRLEITPILAERTNGFPAPNTRPMAAGRPGTRQVLLDTSLGQTIWSVRLYGIGDSSATLNLVATLRQPEGEADTAKTEGPALLDAILGTLELYDWTQPAPTPAALDGSIADNWQSYATWLESSAGPLQVSFRFPVGWWVYPRGTDGFEVLNYVDGAAGAGGLLPQGGIRLSFSLAACADVGGCPQKPAYLFTGLPGTREVITQPDGKSNWLVRIYAAQNQLTLFGTVSGSEHEIARELQLLNMILRTLKVK